MLEARRMTGRWNESPVAMLSSLEMLGQPVHVSPSESSDLASAVCVPPLKVSASRVRLYIGIGRRLSYRDTSTNF